LAANHESGLPHVLVVDDDEQIRKQLQWELSDRFVVHGASDRHQALELFRDEEVHIVLLDLGLPPRPRDATEGLQALEEMLAISPMTKVIVVSGNSDRRNAVTAVERGAYDIFPKPIDLDQLQVVLDRVQQRIELEGESVEPGDACEPVFEDMIGSSPRMQAVYSTVRKVATTDVPVLITGESGTGKERVANAVHRLSARQDKPFVPINCGAIPESLVESELFGHEKGAFTGAAQGRRGKFEYADGGTLFLDEIGELVPSVQVKLLRFLQEQVIERVGGREAIRIDSRIVAATHVDLEAAVAEGRFREDLYYRLAVVRVDVPPLRERGDDAFELAEYFTRVFAQEYGKPPKKLSRRARTAIESHTWAGNVRELQNRVKRAVVLAEGSTIGPTELDLASASNDPTTRPRTTLREAREEVEREIVARALAENRGNISRTSRELGISRPTLYDLISRYGLEIR